MGKRRKRKLIWLNEWDIWEQEAWFSDMAAKGWELVDIGKRLATFEQAPPQDIKYLCDIFEKDSLAADKRIGMYEHAGWKHVTSRKYIQVFKEVSTHDPADVMIDQENREKTTRILRKNMKQKVISSIVLTMIAIFLQYLTLRGDKVGNYLEDGFLFFFIAVIFYMYLVVGEVRGLWHISKLMNKLPAERSYADGASYPWKILLKKLTTIAATVFLALSIVYVFKSVFASDVKDKIPQGDLQVVRLTDVIDSSAYEQEKSINPDEFSYDFYAEGSSWFVPVQYELRESIDIRWKSNEGKYSPFVVSYHYEVRNEWFAKRFIQVLKKEQLAYGEKFQFLHDDRFDELWVRGTEESTEMLARSKNTVFQFSLYNLPQENDIRERVLNKMKQLE